MMRDDQGFVELYQRIMGLGRVILPPRNELIGAKAAE